MNELKDKNPQINDGHKLLNHYLYKCRIRRGYEENRQWIQSSKIFSREEKRKCDRSYENSWGEN